MEVAPVTQLIYARLEAAILSGCLKPRERLVERALEKEYGVSRTPIREALKQLHHAGLVQATTGRGVIVRDVDVAEVFNLYMVRLPLEKLAIEITPAVTTEDLASLRAILDRIDKAFDTHDFPRMVALNAEFHRALTALTGNEWLLSTLEHIRRQCYLIVQHGPVAGRAGLAVSLNDHRCILELLASRDLERLTALTFKHILRSALFYLRRGSTIDPGAAAREAALKDAAAHLLQIRPLRIPSFPRPAVLSALMPIFDQGLEQTRPARGSADAAKLPAAPVVDLVRAARRKSSLAASKPKR